MFWIGSSKKGSEHLPQGDRKRAENPTWKIWVLRVRVEWRCVASVGEPMGFLVISLGVSSVEKVGMYTRIVRRIRYVFIVTSQVISSPVV